MLSFWGGPQRLPTQRLIKALLLHIPAPPLLSLRRTHMHTHTPVLALWRQYLQALCACSWATDRQGVTTMTVSSWGDVLKQSHGSVTSWSWCDESRVNMVNMPGNFGQNSESEQYNRRMQVSEKWNSLYPQLGWQWTNCTLTLRHSLWGTASVIPLDRSVGWNKRRPSISAEVQTE